MKRRIQERYYPEQTQHKLSLQSIILTPIQLPSPSIILIMQDQQSHRDIQLPALTYQSHQLNRRQYLRCQNTNQEHQQHEQMKQQRHQPQHQQEQQQHQQRQQHQQQDQEQQEQQQEESLQELEQQQHQKQNLLRSCPILHYRSCYRSSRIMNAFFIMLLLHVIAAWECNTNSRVLVEAGEIIIAGSTHQIERRISRRRLDQEFSRGDPSCPCLQNLDDYPISNIDRKSALSLLGRTTNYSTYGLGCETHDINTPQCDAPSSCIDTNQNSSSVMWNESSSKLFCDYSWCQRQFCYVDPNNCDILHRSSSMFLNRFYSYATCNYEDVNVNHNRFASIQNKTIRIAMNSNTGGWKGSYHKNATQFDTNITNWKGPLIDFFQTASLMGQFNYILIEAQESLRNETNIYFASNSSFDLCVYMTALGYVDICIAQYTMTELRSLTLEWMLMDNDGLYLFIMNDNKYITSYYQYFFQSVPTIFSPFTLYSWMLILLFVIPMFSFLMIFHEQGKPGSTFPQEQTVVVTFRSGQTMIQKRKVPYWSMLLKSFYITLLAVLQARYEQSVITVGAMLNLLGLSFFILTIIAVYTANLAAILTQNAKQVPINDIQDAIANGYRFCSERKNMKVIIDLYPNINPNNVFVYDPIDNLPGYNTRNKAFDMIDPIQAQYNKSYCHAGIAPFEDLEVLQQKSLHCNKTQIGTPIRTVSLGIPISSRNVPAISSFLFNFKNQGFYDRAQWNHVPQPRCQNVMANPNSVKNTMNLDYTNSNYNPALGISQLSGIWVVCFGFAIMGLIYTCFEFYYDKKKATYSIEHVHKFNQRGARINSFHEEPKWVKEKINASRRMSRFSRHLSAYQSESSKKSFNQFIPFRFQKKDTSCRTLDVDQSIGTQKSNKSIRLSVGFKDVIVNEIKDIDNDDSFTDDCTKSRMMKLNQIILGLDDDDDDSDNNDDDDNNNGFQWNETDKQDEGIVFSSAKQVSDLETIHEEGTSHNSDLLLVENGNNDVVRIEVDHLNGHNRDRPRYNSNDDDDHHSNDFQEEEESLDMKDNTSCAS